MICFETKRMIAKSEMIIQNGNLAEKRSSNNAKDILHLNPMTGLESAFVFFDKVDNGVKLCHIGITHKRGRFEVSYGTEEQFRRQGYMKEALAHLVNWIFTNTNEPEIWGLPNGEESEHILQTSGFVYYRPFKECPTMKWYRIENPAKEEA